MYGTVSRGVERNRVSAPQVLAGSVRSRCAPLRFFKIDRVTSESA